MKKNSRVFCVMVLGSLLAGRLNSACAQAIAPEKSAHAAAMSDTRLIALGIVDNEDALLLSHQAAGHAVDGRIKELAQQMVEDHSTILYGLQQLQSAGGADPQGSAGPDARHRQAAELNNQLSGVSGYDFDTVWVAGLVPLQQGILAELSQEKETITNPQLKTAITEAIPLIRRHCNQLRVLQKDLAKAAAMKKKQSTTRKSK